MSLTINYDTINKKIKWGKHYDKKISLKNLKRIFPKCNTESVLYLDENANILYKIIYMKYLSLQRIETINKLQEIY